MKKYISIILSILILSTVLVGCGEKTPELVIPEDQLEILQTDNDSIKIVKQAYNELQRYMLGDIFMVNMSRVTTVSTQDYTSQEDYTDAIIIKDKGRELYNETDMDYICIYTKDGNYILTSSNEVIDADPNLTNFTDNIYESYYKIIDWLLNNSEKFEYSKNLGEDNTISYVLKTYDTAFVKEKYYSSFGPTEFLEFIDGYYEFVFTFDIDNRLSQIDWFGSNADENTAIEAATTFSTNLSEGYLLLGDNIENIWEMLP